MLQEARAYAEENGLFFVETSAKNAINVNDIFYEIGIVLSFLPCWDSYLGIIFVLLDLFCVFDFWQVIIKW